MHNPSVTGYLWYVEEDWYIIDTSLDGSDADRQENEKNEPSQSIHPPIKNDKKDPSSLQSLYKRRPIRDTTIRHSLILSKTSVLIIRLLKAALLHL